MTRPVTGAAALRRLGFEDVEASLAALETIGAAADPLLAFLARTADPDAAVAGLCRLAEQLEKQGEDPAAMLRELVDDEGTAMRLLSVLGASEALTDHLCRHPDHWRELCDPTLGSTRPAAYAVRESLLASVGADPHAPTPTATLPDEQAVDALRVEYRRVLLRLAARDLAHDLGVDDAAAELSDLAAGTLDAALAVARARVGPVADGVRLAVVAMGKCGGHELNYVSDVDVIFVHEPAEATAVATRLATQLMRVCADHTGEGTIWPVDANLRPEGRSGPLTRTLASHQGYYERWAKTWEFQALLKARAVAGDLALGRAFTDMVQPHVWSAAGRDGFVADTQAMRRRVVDHIPAKDADRELKLGPGGLRDVEFAVQLLQLVHGRYDDSIRAPTTLSALAQLTEAGYVGRGDGDALHRSYSFLRLLEHRIQLHGLRRTHVVPDDQDRLRHLGRGMGFLKDPAASLDRAWRARRRDVQRLHQKLFYRPLLTAVAQIGEQAVGGARLSPAAAQTRLAALGYADPAAALRHLEALSGGVSRSAVVQRTLLPAMLQWFAEGPDPDAGLFGFRRISESLGRSPWYLRTLRDEGQVAERLAAVLSSSAYATGLLEREPQGVRMLGEDLSPLASEPLVAEMTASAGRRDGLDEAVRAVRAIRRRELFRIAAGDLLGLTDVSDVGTGLSRLTDATLESALQVVERDVVRRRGLDQPPTAFAVVAMGRYGGFELSYASDADVLFVHRPEPGADPQAAASYAQAVASELRRTLGLHGDDPPLLLDAGLRPEGAQGALVRTLDSYAAYYGQWSAVWEAQALLRADAVVGDLGVRAGFTAMVNPLRYPGEGLSEADAVEVRRIKARVDAERLPRGADPHTHLKLGRGGLADVEWTVQLLQLQHAAAVPTLRTTRTLDALVAARDADLLAADDADVLVEGWRLVSRVRNAVTLIRGRSTDQLPTAAVERAALASILGYPAGATGDMLDDYLRTTRQTRAVVDRVFWG